MQQRPLMQKMTVPVIALGAILVLSHFALAQARLPGAVYDFDKKGEKPGPAPRRDISGVWEPASGPGGGIQGKGAAAMESCKREKPGGKDAGEPNAAVAGTGLPTTAFLK